MLFIWLDVMHNKLWRLKQIATFALFAVFTNYVKTNSMTCFVSDMTLYFWFLWFREFSADDKFKIDSV